MPKQGQSVTVKGTVVRVDGDRVDIQTPSGQLIQTHVDNIESSGGAAIKMPIAVAGGAIERDVKAAAKANNKRAVGAGS